MDRQDTKAPRKGRSGQASRPCQGSVENVVRGMTFTSPLVPASAPLVPAETQDSTDPGRVGLPECWRGLGTLHSFRYEEG